MVVGAIGREAMKETEALIRLQEIDLSIMRHKRTLAAMPQVKKLGTIRAARKKLASEVNRIVGRRKDVEMDLVENENSTKRLKEIVGEVQQRYQEENLGYRELADIEAQLTSLAKKLEKRSFQHGELNNALERVQAEEHRAREMDERLVAEAESLIASYKSQSAEIEQELSELTAEREQVTQSISQSILEQYDEATKRFGGLAVETLKGNKPSTCRVAIPPSSFADVRKGPDITTCPYCHRLLVTEGVFNVG